MTGQREKALELGRVKAVREQTKILVYEDKSTENEDYLVSPKDLSGKTDLRLVDTFDSSLESSKEEEVVSIEDYSDLEEGDQVLINEDESDQVIRVTQRQLVTLSGDKFRRSDGKLWGNNDSERQITHKVLV